MADEGAYTDPPTGTARRKALRIIVAALAFQLVVPLTYYMRSDPYDERFAWRMFSAVRLHRCQTTATETVGEVEQSIALSRVIHRAWVNHLSRNRRDVVHAFLHRRCREEGVTHVKVQNDCSTPDGATLEPQLYELECSTGELSEPGELILEQR